LGILDETECLLSEPPTRIYFVERCYYFNRLGTAMYALMDFATLKDEFGMIQSVLWCYLPFIFMFAHVCGAVVDATVRTAEERGEVLDLDLTLQKVMSCGHRKPR